MVLGQLGHRLDLGSRTQDVKISQDVTFETMLLSDTTLQGLNKSGFYKPSPIQLHGIPLGKCGFDLLLEAKSGTGKTAVFTVIALEKINLKNGLQVIILAPTREIASQICDVIKQIGREHQGLNVEVVMGGLPVKDDIERLKKKVHIIVGSPGRLHHLIRDKHIDTSTVRLLVLDEADKLMEKSFRADIEYLFTTLPTQRQIIFSSATFPEESKSFINKYVQVSQHICPDSNSVLLGISQKVTLVSHNVNIVRQTQHRFEELLNILSKREFKQCLIFCNYQARVTDLYKMLKKAKWPAEKLYGQQEQLDRLEALKTLQEYKCRILIATDLAARGLDSSHVDLVINFEPPHDWQTYLHRIGRAGRFGAYGLAVTILSNQEETKFKELLNAMQFQLDISYFWNDELFQYNEDGSKMVLPLEHTMTMLKLEDDDDGPTNENNYSELWNALTYETTQENDNTIETFEMLCTSFKEANNKIETFTDLLNSFQKNSVDSHSHTSSKYVTLQTIPVATVSVKKYKQLKKQHCGIPNDQVELKVEYKEIPIVDEVIPNVDEMYKRMSENGHYQDIIVPKRVKRKDKDEYRHKHKKPTEKNNRHNTFENLQIHSRQKNEKQISSKDSDEETNGESSEKSDDYGYNTASYDFMKSQSNSANNENCANNQNNYNYSLNQQRDNEQMYGYTSSYINWYKYLKFRTQQVEMAVYINEMSQL